MKVENLNITINTNTEAEVRKAQVNIQKDFTKALNIKPSSQGIEIQNNINKEMIKNFAEWYFKQGQLYEKTKSYIQAISAYEKANSVVPDIQKANAIANARNKAYEK